MNPENDTISLWQVAIDEVDTGANELYRLLSGDEKERSGSFRFEADRGNFVARRAQLRKLLGWYLSVDPAEIRFSANSSGKPLVAFPQQPELHFSLSHSGNIMACAICPYTEIGIDIERIEPADDLMDVAGTHFSPAEQAKLGDLTEPARTQAFFRLWTIKEAVVKAKSLNLEEGLQLPCVADSQDSRIIITTPGDGNPLTCLTDILEAPGYASALAIASRPDSPITLHRHIVKGATVIESFHTYPPATLAGG
ncbi:MAG: 4'-phosphopantetheinyl transferase superfamily protein [Chlorobiaceae bacterium]|nr:4'-phosphopantetheinyl transferase superfamily protein [Chlorobiaceae bacterium]